jgi:hypothetical protein
MPAGAENRITSRGSGDIEGQNDQRSALPLWRRRRVVSGLILVVYLSLLGAFFLPFLSVSCQTDDASIRSEVLTGWDLIVEDEYVLIEGPGDPAEFRSNVDPRRKAQAALDTLSDATTVSFLAVIFCILIALTVTSFTGPVAVLFVSSLVAAIACFSLATAGQDFISFESVDVKHHYGYGIAFGLAAFGLVSSYWLLRISNVSIEAELRSKPGLITSLILGLLLLLCTFIVSAIIGFAI